MEKFNGANLEIESYGMREIYATFVGGGLFHGYVTRVRGDDAELIYHSAKLNNWGDVWDILESVDGNIKRS